MNRDLAKMSGRKASIAVAEKQFLQLRNAKGCRIVCLSGIALITACSERRDIDLHAADDFVVPNNGLVLVEGVRDAVLSVERQASRPSYKLHFRHCRTFTIIKTWS